MVHYGQVACVIAVILILHYGQVGFLSGVVAAMVGMGSDWMNDLKVPAAPPLPSHPL